MGLAHSKSWQRARTIRTPQRSQAQETPLISRLWLNSLKSLNQMQLKTYLSTLEYVVRGDDSIRLSVLEPPRCAGTTPSMPLLKMHWAAPSCHPRALIIQSSWQLPTHIEAFAPLRYLCQEKWSWCRRWIVFHLPVRAEQWQEGARFLQLGSGLVNG